MRINSTTDENIVSIAAIRLHRSVVLEKKENDNLNIQSAIKKIQASMEFLNRV
jgi:hypothetical protein